MLYKNLIFFRFHLDQDVNYLEKYLDLVNSNTEDKIITKTMINNYVKQGIMPAPEKKKYNKSHIAYLIVICVLKQVYSIGDIGKLISGTIEYFEIGKAYNRFTHSSYLPVFSFMYSNF